MDIYVSNDHFKTGGSGRLPCRKAAVLEPEHFLSLAQWITDQKDTRGWAVVPPRKDSSGSKAKPLIWIHETSFESFRDTWNPVVVSDNHVEVVSAICKYRLAKSGTAPLSPRQETGFQLKIRSKLIQLLEAGDWIDDPREYFDHSQISRVQKLNWEFEKIDLGRRKDLNYSSIQENADSKLGRRSTKLYPEVTGILRDWIDSDEAGRQTIENEKPYLISMLKANPHILKLSSRHQ